MDRNTEEVHERAIAAHLGCTAWYTNRTVPVEVEVDGVKHEKHVHIYRLLHHPRATNCFVFEHGAGVATILEEPPTDSPERAVIEAIRASTSGRPGPP